MLRCSGSMTTAAQLISLRVCRYAFERAEDHMKMWFWSRYDGSVPSEVKNGYSNINPDNWVRKPFTIS